MKTMMSLFLFVPLFFLPLCAQSKEKGGGINTAMNDPDRFAWELFVHVNRPADKPNMVQWQTWANTAFTYLNPCEAPTWPTQPQNELGQTSRLLTALNHFIGAQSPFNSANSEQTFYNRAAFDYVVDEELWYAEGVLRKAQRNAIDFPEAALILKTSWRPIEAHQKAQYHWQMMKQGEDGELMLMGLDGFHLVSKALPSWFWSTFEHVDNLGRCDAIGCRDTFGSNPAIIAPHMEGDRPYPPGKLTKEVSAMFAKANLADIWKQYRLKGTMVTFSDDMGRPNLLGSSVLEPNFEAQSSCMTCHTRASTSNNTTGLSAGLGIVESITPLGGNIGTPDPSWFFTNSVPPATSARVVFRTDFLWGLTDISSREDCSENSP